MRVQDAPAADVLLVVLDADLPRPGLHGGLLPAHHARGLQAVPAGWLGRESRARLRERCLSSADMGAAGRPSVVGRAGPTLRLLGCYGCPRAGLPKPLASLSALDALGVTVNTGVPCAGGL